MLPGKASNDPVPIDTRIVDVTNAISTAYIGPKMTAAIILIICWTGKTFATPIGMLSPDSTTPLATSSAAIESFFLYLT